MNNLDRWKHTENLLITSLWQPKKQLFVVLWNSVANSPELWVVDIQAKTVWGIDRYAKKCPHITQRCADTHKRGPIYIPQYAKPAPDSWCSECQASPGGWEGEGFRTLATTWCSILHLWHTIRLDSIVLITTPYTGTGNSVLQFYLRLRCQVKSSVYQMLFSFQFKILSLAYTGKWQEEWRKVEQSPRTYPRGAYANYRQCDKCHSHCIGSEHG